MWVRAILYLNSLVYPLFNQSFSHVIICLPGSVESLWSPQSCMVGVCAQQNFQGCMDFWSFQKALFVTESSHVKWIFLQIFLKQMSSLVYFTVMLQKGCLSVLMQIAFLRALFLLFICVSRAVITFLPIRPNDITEQHYKWSSSFNMKLISHTELSKE